MKKVPRDMIEFCQLNRYGTIPLSLSKGDEKPGCSIHFHPTQRPLSPLYTSSARLKKTCRPSPTNYFVIPSRVPLANDSGQLKVSQTSHGKGRAHVFWCFRGNPPFPSGTHTRQQKTHQQNAPIKRQEQADKQNNHALEAWVFLPQRVPMRAHNAQGAWWGRP